METLVKNSTTAEVLAINTEITTISELWAATIEYYNGKVLSTDALKHTLKRANPALSLQDIVNVIVSVYANTYFNLVKIDATVIIKDLVKALGLTEERASVLAYNALKEHRGSYSRNNPTDAGVYGNQNNLTNSVDIVCNQESSLVPSHLIENWNKELYSAPVQGKNFVHVRVENKNFDGALDISTQLYTAPAGFNQPCHRYEPCLTTKENSVEGRVYGQDNNQSLLNRGERGVSEAFHLNTENLQHVSVVATLKDQYFTNNEFSRIPEGNLNSSTLRTLGGAIVAHNLGQQVAPVTKLDIFNQDGTNETFVFNLQCRNVPAGYKVSLYTEDKLINSGEVVVNREYQLVQTEFTLPGNYKGQVHVHIEGPNGELLPQRACVELSLLWKVQKGHVSYTRVSEYTNQSSERLYNDTTLYPSLGAYTLTGGQPLSSKN